MCACGNLSSGQFGYQNLAGGEVYIAQVSSTNYSSSSGAGLCKNSLNDKANNPNPSPTTKLST